MKQTGIYVLGSADERFYKIGRSVDVPKRVAQHGQPGPEAPGNVFLFSIAGMPSDEAYLHREFRSFRERGEWFRRGSTIDGYMRWLYRQGYACRDATAHPRLLTTSCAWLPGPGRFLERPLELTFDPWTDITCAVQHGGNDFHTHEEVIACVRGAMGSIDLDPASHPDANDVVRAAHYFTEYMNGLTQAWFGNVWLNPPFGEWDNWVPKVMSELDSVVQMVLLMPSRGICDQVRRPVKKAANGLVIPKKRYPFRGKKATSSPDEGHVLFYFGDRWEEARGHFDPIGESFSR